MSKILITVPVSLAVARKSPVLLKTIASIAVSWALNTLFVLLGA